MQLNLITVTSRVNRNIYLRLKTGRLYSVFGVVVFDPNKIHIIQEKRVIVLDFMVIEIISYFDSTLGFPISIMVSTYQGVIRYLWTEI